ncbi:thiamine pyrophosphate-dependent enzyme [Lentisphaerota bacterium ZTH]|nr:thiamine pyrophosphate-binding protein [Lentisphaerota bacterium]WET07250.1 thiamine pyrophosphate-dependent enzyme [Lentisphaerota bacterium ZTH]
MAKRLLLSGNEAIAQAALDGGVHLGTGYPGTPSSEILEHFSTIGGNAQWAPNEKVALEVGIGAAYGQARVITTMKHVGLNVAADPLFTIAYAGTPGGLVIISADDPGMASSQNEQDNRRYAIAAGVPLLEPADSQEAYDFTIKALELSEKYRVPVILRVTTRICHSKCVVSRTDESIHPPAPKYERDIKQNVMVPAYARVAHRKMRAKLKDIARFNESSEFTKEERKSSDLGIITNGISYQHSRDAAPEASILKLGLTYPMPLKRIQTFAGNVKRCVVIEEGDPVIYEFCRANGIDVEGKAEMYRFGELNVSRVRRIIANDLSEETKPPTGKPPQLCPGCPHRRTFETLRDLGCIVTGDIGCYTLGVLPPFEAMDTCVCMGASIGTGLGMRHVLTEKQARKVVSVIGDSTFLHTGINGIVEMVYNRPPTGHVVLILDNSTTAMTGLQEHPGTGRKLDHSPAPKIIVEDMISAMGVDNVDIVDPLLDYDQFLSILKARLSSNDLSVIIVRRPCILAAVKIKKYEETSARGDK